MRSWVLTSGAMNQMRALCWGWVGSFLQCSKTRAQMKPKARWVMWSRTMGWLCCSWLSRVRNSGLRWACWRSCAAVSCAEVRLLLLLHSQQRPQLSLTWTAMG